MGGVDWIRRLHQPRYVGIAMSRTLNFEGSNRSERMRRQGYEELNPKAVHFEPTRAVEAERAKRLRRYLETSPSGERDVSKDLDRLERQRGTWLRDVLDACEDEQ